MNYSTSIKTDTLGRIRISEEERCELLAEFDQSSLSASQFAKDYGIKYSTFACWLQKRKKSRTSKQPYSEPDHLEPLHAFAEVKVEQADCKHEGLNIKLGHNIEVQMVAAQQAPLIAALIKSLA